MASLLDQLLVEPFHRLTGQLGQVWPPLFSVTVILVVGGTFAWAARRGVYALLVALHLDRRIAQTGLARAVERTGVFRSPAEFASRAVEGALWLFIVLLAISAAGTPFTQQWIQRFVAFLPDLVTAVLVLLLGSVISRFLARSALLAAVNAHWAGARLMAGGVRVLVMSLTVAVALEQLRIGRATLLVSFAILFAGVILAAAIAFGLGARDLAREWLRAKLQPPPAEEEEVFRHL